MKFKKVLTILIAAAFIFAIASIAVRAENQPAQTGNSTVQKSCSNCDGTKCPDCKAGKGKMGKGAKMSPENRQAMMDIQKKYKDNAEFQAMMKEIKAVKDNVKNQFKNDIDTMKTDNQKMMQDYKAKLDAAKTDEEKAKIKQEFKTQMQANRDKRKAQMAPMKQSMDTQMAQIKTKYQSKFPDFFALTDKIKAEKAKNHGGPGGKTPPAGDAKK
ncbi:MAG: hypothetical protein LWY06_01205 [Firmicutes bacterium]|nr:hypothetical protein [Bacillota bacterium]